jgi:hypothetical protein
MVASDATMPSFEPMTLGPFLSLIYVVLAVGAVVLVLAQKVPGYVRVSILLMVLAWLGTVALVPYH